MTEQAIDTRIRVDSGAEAEGPAVGEAGLHHFRLALRGHTVPNRLHAQEIAEALCRHSGIECARAMPRVIYRAARKSLRGNYSRGSGTIQLFGVPRLATLIHELAHHLNSDDDRETQIRYTGKRDIHGKRFKRALEALHLAAGELLGYDMRAMAAEASQLRTAEASAFEIGAVVTFPRDRRQFRIVRKLRKNFVIRDLDTGREFRGGPRHGMTLVSGGAA